MVQATWQAAEAAARWSRHAAFGYVLGCEMPMSADAKSGTGYATHTDAGMLLAFEIAE